MPHSIPLSQAADMTARYRDNMEIILSQDYQEQSILAQCETFDRNAIDTILAQEGCMKLRIYYGMDTELKVHAILVGVNENDEDMIPLNEEDDTIAENSIRCPTICPPESPLNG